MLLFSLWIAITGTFFLMHAIPGDPFIGDKVIPEEVLKSLYAYFGLDQPIYIQYFKYIAGLLKGDLGPSIVYQGRTVNQLIQDAFPISFQLGMQALLIAIPSGILLGTWGAMRKNRWQDATATILSTLGICVPNFIFSTLLQFIFSMKLHLFPVALWGDFEHTILPTIALAATPTAVIARLTRANMIEVLGQDYIKVALSKGLTLFQASLRHGLRNALLPVIAYLGPVTSYILTGSFMVEKIFALPGLGQWMIHSIHGRDYPMIMGLTVFCTTLLMISTFLVDLLYSLLDPRLKRVRHG